MAAVAQRAPSRTRAWPNGRLPRGLVEARRYRIVARHLDIAALPTRLRVKPSAVEDLLAGRVRFLSPAQATRFERLVSKRTARWLRQSPRHEHISGGELPVALIEPLILDSWGRHGKNTTAAMCGLAARTLFRLVDDAEAITFSTADQIVTRLAGADWWTDNNERRGWYFGCDRRLYDRSSDQRLGVC